FKGNDIRGVGPVRLAQMGMARSFQLVSIFPLLTVLEILQVAVLSRRGRGMQLFKSLSRDSEVRDEAIEVATVFRLQEKLHVQSAALPQGDKKLLDVASAFALRPEVILLDEPTSGVSTSDKHVVMEILVQAAKEIGIKSIIQVEHDMDIVFCYSDRIIALHQGKVLADTTPSGIWDDKDVVTTVVGRRLSWG
ncbi:MAG TPA: ATP-binding cassette domain-containing protein, partial [Chloroflexota bacterium]